MVQSEPPSYLQSLLQAAHHSDGVLSRLSPVALVTDQNQSIPAVPAAGLTQAPSPGEGNAASALRHQCSHQHSNFPLDKQICSSNNCLYPHIQLELTKPNQVDK